MSIKSFFNMSFYKSALALLLLCSTIFIACDDDDVNAETQGTKYVLVTRGTGSAAGQSGFMSVMSEFPTGAVDNATQVTSKAYPEVDGGIVYKNWIFNADPLEGGSGFAKLTVGDDGTLTQEGLLTTVNGGTAIAILNDTKGYFADFNSRNIKIFNPTTMEVTGSVNMDAAFNVPANPQNVYTYFVIRGNRLYASFFSGKSNTYGLTKAVVAVINTDTDTYMKDITYENAKYAGAYYVREGGSIIDEAGNLYLITQGGFGVDVASGSIPGKILKIPAGQDNFDPSYEIVAPGIVMSGYPLKMNRGFLYEGNGIAYTQVVVKPLSKLSGAAVAVEPVFKWVKVNLNTKDVQQIDALGESVGFMVTSAYKMDGKIMLPVYNPDLGINALYEYNSSANTATKLFDITGGGMFFGLHKIGQ